MPPPRPAIHLHDFNSDQWDTAEEQKSFLDMPALDFGGQSQFRCRSWKHNTQSVAAKEM